MHGGCTTPASELLDPRRILALFGQHIDQLADNATHPMKLGLSHDVAPGPATKHYFLLAHESPRERFGLWPSVCQICTANTRELCRGSSSKMTFTGEFE
jgi:hypothetical protein